MSVRTLEALNAAIHDGWADPARLHAEGRQARALLDGARESIAGVLGTSAELTHFTHSPYTAFEKSIAGIALARRRHTMAVVSAVERVAVLETANTLFADGVETIEVDASGMIDKEAFERAVSADGVALAALQHANRETGTVQALQDAFAAAQVAKVPLVVDATASVGHIDPPDVWDALIAHPADWGGPSGLGLVAVRGSTRWLPDSTVKNPWAPGGVSVPAALAAAVALTEREERRASDSSRLARFVARIRADLDDAADIAVVAVPDGSLPHVLTFTCVGVDSEALQAELDRRGYSVGSGSACTSGDYGHSHVLEAMGVPTAGNVRLGLHPAVMEDQIGAFAVAVADAVASLRP